MEKILKKIDNLPESPGVYFFKNKEGKIIYIGKSVNLKKRVKSYFENRNLMPLREKMVKEIVEIDYQETDSEFEALFLEAKEIKKNLPFYNLKGKDNKSFLMIGVTSEEYPRVFSQRQRVLTDEEKEGDYFGPFPTSKEVRLLLNALRKIFPFRSCKKMPKKPCLYYYLKLCPGCCLNIKAKEYQKTIRRIKIILSGRISSFKKEILKEIRQASRRLAFEKANELKKEIEALDYLVLNWRFFIDEDLVSKRYEKEKNEILKEVKKIFPALKIERRIEGYDISNWQGKEATGSMVVFQNLEKDKSQYRRFKIRQENKADDVSMIGEVIKRRLRHKEWSYPDLILIDGGKGQVGSAFFQIRKKNLQNKIALLGLAKKEEKIVKPLLKNKMISGWKEIKLKKNNKFLLFLENIRNEAHRFAKKYHFILRRKKLSG